RVDGAAERVRHGLEAVADAQHGHARLEQRAVDRRRPRLVHAGRPARQDDGGRAPLEDLLDRPRVRHDLRVHVRLAHAARDELRVLGAVVDDEDGTHAGAGALAHAGSLVTASPRARCASASRCTRRSMTKLITGTTPASTIVTSRPQPERTFARRSITVAR